MAKQIGSIQNRKSSPLLKIREWTVISDRKVGVDTWSYTAQVSGNYAVAIGSPNTFVQTTQGTHVQVNGSDGYVDYYTAEIVSSREYSAYGAELPGYNFTPSEYRYQFQNQEVDEEFWSGAVSYKYRIEDARLGRFFSVDPLAPKYPHNSPYAFSENDVIASVELEGLEKHHYTLMAKNDGTVALVYMDSEDIVETAFDLRIYILSNGMVGPWVNLTNKTQKYSIWQWDNEREDNEHFEFDDASIAYQEALEGCDGYSEEDIQVAINEGLVEAITQIQTNIKGLTKLQKYLRPSKTSLKKMIYEAHHLLPKSLTTKGITFLKKAVDGGFDFDGLGNLMPLQKFLRATGEGVHGKHPNYTNQIAKYLDEVEHSAYTPAQAKDYMDQLNDFIFDQISLQSTTKLNDMNLHLDEFLYIPK